MNKTLRNKALKNVDRLIIADMNGDKWCAPDGYFATAHDIYAGYRIKKSQHIPEMAPDLQKILPSTEYVKAKKVEFLPTAINGVSTGRYSYDIYRINDCIDINAVYYDLIMSIYPDAKIHVDKSDYRLAPVKLYQDKTLVAVIMPLKG